MKNGLILLCLSLLSISCEFGTNSQSTQGSIIDHQSANTLFEGRLSISEIQQAKEKLHIGYGHTSHGSQLTSGMNGLVAFADSGALNGIYRYSDYPGLFQWNDGGTSGALDLFDGAGYGSGFLESDAGYYPTWVNETREFLNDPAHGDVNVILWSWCGQLSSATKDVQGQYLVPMEQLQRDYPHVAFVYMTGHLDGSGVNGALHQNNEQIREHCRSNGYWLYDFADIESYDPDGNYYLDQGANDECNYSGGNWATQWQNAHPGQWYSCGSAHSQPLNANRKAYAAWVLWCEIAKTL